LRKRHLQTGNTVLHLSASLGRLDVLSFCKPHFGIDVGRSSGNSRESLSINAINSCHKTALQLAAEKGICNTSFRKLSTCNNWVIINSFKPITKTAWVCARLCKLQKRVHSTRSRK